jgi:hypothetical protein
VTRVTALRRRARKMATGRYTAESR